MQEEELKDLLRQRGQPDYGEKDDLVQRLVSKAMSRPMNRPSQEAGPSRSLTPQRRTPRRAQRAAQAAEDDGDAEELPARPVTATHVERHKEEPPGPDSQPEDMMTWIDGRLKFSKMLEEERPGKTVKALNADAELKLQHYFGTFPEMKETLRTQQVHSVKECLLRRGRCLIADEMGLGKTLTSLVVAQIYSEEWPLLIVAPAGVVKNWVKEVQKWLPYMVSDVMELSSSVASTRRKDIQEAWVNKLIFVLSYDQARVQPALTRRPDGSPYKVVILDEAHYIKTSDSQRTEVLLPACRDASRCILLTGTPVLNHAGETWTLMSALDPTLPPFESFCKRYCKFKPQVGDDGIETLVPHGVERSEELHRVFHSFTVRQKKLEVLTNLTAKKKFKIDFSEAIDGKWKKKVMALKVSVGKSNSAKMKQSLPVRIFAKTAEAKAGPVTEYVQHILESSDTDRKIVVFGHHLIMLDGLEKMCQKIGRKYIRIDGKVPKHRRQGIIDKFQEEPDIQVALAGMKACGHGISFTAASLVIFAELHWVPASMLQAEDRVHRHGQERDVEIVYCVAEGQPFMDDSILKRVCEKEQIANLITDGKKLESAFSLLPTDQADQTRDVPLLCSYYLSPESLLLRVLWLCAL